MKVDLVAIVGSVLLLLVGCNNPTTANAAEPDSLVLNVNNLLEVKGKLLRTEGVIDAFYEIPVEVDPLANVISREIRKMSISKSEYIKKINQIEQGLSNLDYLNARALNFEFKEVEMEIYNSWEKALNEIYEALSQQLTSSEMAILREEQHQWIMERELTAKKESQHESGTLDSLQYLSVLTSLTKERCYELMDHIK